MGNLSFLLEGIGMILLVIGGILIAMSKWQHSGVFIVYGGIVFLIGVVCVMASKYVPKEGK